MVRFIALLLATSLMVSCSKKKEEEGSTDPSAGITNEEMNFDPLGSDSGNVSGLASVNFGYDQASLTSSARKILEQNAGWINSNSGVTVQVEGHCDERGSIEYNLALGERRARAVKDYLIGLGVDAGRLTIISYGEEKPLAVGAHARNRRANFVPLAQ